MTEIIFRPAAAADVEDAFRRYEAQRIGLGSEFLAAVKAGVEALVAHPEINGSFTGIPDGICSNGSLMRCTIEFTLGLLLESPVCMDAETHCGGNPGVDG